jgi:uncharacterized protein (TIGR02145 family)
MKKIYTLVSTVLLSVSLWAQAPAKMSYQAVIRGANNSLVIEKTVGVRISILQGNETGSSVYSELHTPTTNLNGLASLSIGGGKNTTGDFAKIDWSKGPYFVKTETDVAGGTNYQLTAVSELMSVPYALNSKESGNGIKSVSKTGDTLNLNNGNFVLISGISLANHKPTSGYGPSISDVEGNTYKTVYIGTQQWMGENLKSAKYNDGTAIPNITDTTQWSKLITGAWAYHKNDAANNAKYGKLYNWYAVSSTINGNKNVCPTGWHVPTDVEWTVLTDYLGGQSVAGGKMKEVGTTNWNIPNKDATNMSLFSSISVGKRYGMGWFEKTGDDGSWWSSSEYPGDNGAAINRRCVNVHGGVNRDGEAKQAGISIRCLRD